MCSYQSKTNEEIRNPLKANPQNMSFTKAQFGVLQNVEVC